MIDKCTRFSPEERPYFAEVAEILKVLYDRARGPHGSDGEDKEEAPTLTMVGKCNASGMNRARGAEGGDGEDKEEAPTLTMVGKSNASGIQEEHKPRLAAISKHQGLQPATMDMFDDDHQVVDDEGTPMFEELMTVQF